MTTVIVVTVQYSHVSPWKYKTILCPQTWKILMTMIADMLFPTANWSSTSPWFSWNMNWTSRRIASRKNYRQASSLALISEYSNKIDSWPHNIFAKISDLFAWVTLLWDAVCMCLICDCNVWCEQERLICWSLTVASHPLWCVGTSALMHTKYCAYSHLLYYCTPGLLVIRHYSTVCWRYQT